MYTAELNYIKTQQSCLINIQYRCFIDCTVPAQWL